jgi:hypothetical protein
MVDDLPHRPSLGPIRCIQLRLGEAFHGRPQASRRFSNLLDAPAFLFIVHRSCVREFSNGKAEIVHGSSCDKVDEVMMAISASVQEFFGAQLVLKLYFVSD